MNGQLRPPAYPNLSNEYSIDGYQEGVAVHEVAARFYREQVAGSWAREYLAGRGFHPDVQQRWQIGYAPAGRQALIRHLRGEAYRDALIVAAGLARRSRYGELSDVFRDRVMFPIRSSHGATIGFIGRAPEHANADVPKYLNTPATLLYDKGQVLFGLAEARPALAAGAVPVIAEGPLDAIAVAMAGGGTYAPVAPCGTALTAHQVSALSQFADLAATGTLIAFDSDDAGRRAAVGAYPLLRSHTGRIGAAPFPAGQDPAQILRENGPAVLAEMLARNACPLADLVIDAQLAQWERWTVFAEGQIAALRAIAPVIAGLALPDVARQVARLAERLELDHPTVTEAVTDALTALIRAGPPTGNRQGHHAELPGAHPVAVSVSSQDSPHRIGSRRLTSGEQAANATDHPRPQAGAARLLPGSRVAG